jgi:hypothetical protein
MATDEKSPVEGMSRGAAMPTPGPNRRALFLSAALLAALAVPADASPPKRATIDFHRWRSGTDFQSGFAEGAGSTESGIGIDHPVSTVTGPNPSKQRYDFARWTSPPYPVGFGATQLVASWNARTPPGTWLEVEMRGRTNTGAQTRWFSFGPWASGDGDIQRTSIPGQADPHGQLDVDTFATSNGTTLTGYQLRVTLYRAAGTAVSPSVSMLGAMASAIPDRFEVPTSAPGGAWGLELPVPRYSQDVHKGHYPQYGGGGESWCSPTSTEMVIEYWGHHPSPSDLSWVQPGHVDPTIDQAARSTFDRAYQGTGNWPFNAAYAATYGLDAHITRLDSLHEAEGYIARGIPVITSQSFRAGEIDGARYDTEGHIMVVVGFTKTGDVIVNDPASPDDAAVRHIYPRKQFENVWLRTKRRTADGKVADGSGGIAYIVSPPHA